MPMEDYLPLLMDASSCYLFLRPDTTLTVYDIIRISIEKATHFSNEISYLNHNSVLHCKVCLYEVSLMLKFDVSLF